MNKIFGYTPTQWVLAFLDLLDGSSSWYDIKYNTGLSEERCKELEKMFIAATKDGWPKVEDKS